MRLLKRGLLPIIVVASVSTHAPAQSTVPSGQKQQLVGAVLVSLSRPSFPQLARTANVSGKVNVLVTVDQDGTTKAVVLDGPAMLREAALESARSSRFDCNRCEASAEYSMTYAFVRTERGNCCDGVSAPVEVRQEPESTDQRGMRHTEVVISTEHFCLCDPPGEIGHTRVRSFKCFYLWKCGFRQ